VWFAATCACVKVLKATMKACMTLATSIAHYVLFIG
jgi:hypothetical protein